MDTAELRKIAEQYRDIKFDRVFDLAQMHAGYSEYIKHMDGRKVKLGIPTFDNELGMIRPSQVVTIIGATNIGKMLTLDTIIPTPNGNKTMNDLKVGDYVFDENGNPTKVKFVTDTQLNLFYKIIFDDNVTIECCGEHLWEVSTQKDRCNFKKRSKGDYSIKTRIMKTEDMIGIYRQGDRSNLSIKNAKSLNYKEWDFEIPAYILGLWLGDGNSSHTSITNIDKEIIKVWAEYAESLGMKIRISDKINYFITNGKVGDSKNDFLDNLRELNLIKNKHIPEIYFYGSVQQRLSLLQGLLDTDGYASKQNGYCQFSNNNFRLAKDVKRLVSTLGGKAHISSKIPKLNGKECNRNYSVTFKIDKPAFRLKRKLKHQDRTFKSRQGKRTIKKIESIGFKKGKCIQVANKTGLYLCTDFCVPTHNTTIAMNIAFANCTMAQDKLIAFFNLEIDENEIYERALQMEFDLYTYEVENAFKKGDTETLKNFEYIHTKYKNFISVIGRVDIDDIIPYIKAIEESYHREVGFVIIDHIGLVRNSKYSDEYARVTDNAMKVKEMALHLRKPFLDLSQTSRADVKNNDKGLNLYSGKSSGEIENSSQIVITMDKLTPDKALSENVPQHLIDLANDQKIYLIHAKIQKKKQGNYASVVLMQNRKNLRITEIPGRYVPLSDINAI